MICDPVTVSGVCTELGLSLHFDGEDKLHLRQTSCEALGEDPLI
jgi:hypothetical protein